MKNCWPRLKANINIQRFVLVAIVVVAAALVFVIVIILKPDWFPNFPLVRDSVSALSTAAMVLATLVLAYATFTIIKNDREKEKRNRDERLVNEIIEWAIDVNKCGMGHQSIFSQAVMTDPVTPEKMFRSLTVLYDLASNIQGEASTLIVRSEHIKNICQKVFNKDLHDIIEKVIAALNEYNNSLLSELDAIPLDTTIKASDMNRLRALAIEVSEHKQVVKKLTNELLEKAANLMTADIE